MKQLGRVILMAAVLFGATTGDFANAGPEIIQPTVNLALPTISFGPGINPIGGSYSNDALNIIRAHAVALQQVQAAIQYLIANRDNILAGRNAAYNAAFGDFYDPNSQFAGQYARTLQKTTGGTDRFGNLLSREVYNTEHYDRVLYVYQQIALALNSSITYSLGAQYVDDDNDPTTPMVLDPLYETYRHAVPVVGDPGFSGAFVPGKTVINNILIDPRTGKPYFDTFYGQPMQDPITGITNIDPRTNRPYTVPGTGIFTPLRQFPPPPFLSTGINNPQITLDAALERGLVQWGDSTSFSPKHLTQIGTNPNNPLRWDDDNDLSTTTVPLTADQELAFFKDRLDAYAVKASSTTTNNVVVSNPETIFIGGAFLNEEQRSNSTPPGEPNSFFHGTELRQYQMIIAALAQSDGSTSTVLTGANGTTTITNGVSIEPGLLELFGQSANFFEALDSRSYALFADALRPIQDGGIGDGTLLPPPGKHGTADQVFIPFVPAP